MKEQIQKILSFYVLSNIHVAVSIVSLYLIFNEPVDLNYLFFVFSATILTYTFIRLISFGSNRFFTRRFYLKNKILIISILTSSTIISAYTFIKMEMLQKLWLVPFFLLSFFYNLDIDSLPFSKLRTNGIVKIFVVALVWTGLIIIVPQYQVLNHTQALWRALFVFIYIFLLTTSFDQRDVLIDHHDLKTIPQIFKRMHYFYLVFGFVLIGLAFLIFTNIHKELTSILIILLSIALCYKSDKHKSFYYTAFWIEGLPILWFLSLKLLS